jgi:hypothetical protein
LKEKGLAKTRTVRIVNTTVGDMSVGGCRDWGSRLLGGGEQDVFDEFLIAGIAPGEKSDARLTASEEDGALLATAPHDGGQSVNESSGSRLFQILIADGDGDEQLARVGLAQSAIEQSVLGRTANRSIQAQIIVDYNDYMYSGPS